MTEKETNDLLRLLRVELTAVHQQFFHMLALRQWERGDLLDRIAAIDTIDFKNTMQIIDLLVSRQVEVALPSHEFLPGTDIKSIVVSELQMEKRVASVIDDLDVSDKDGKILVDRAAAPRKDYRDWLESKVDGQEQVASPHVTSDGMATYIAELVALVEQSMLRAFMLWHSGQKASADNAWRLSGAAMLYGTALVKRAAHDSWLPTPSTCPEVLMTYDAQDAFLSDMALTRRCAELGRKVAAEADNEEMRRTCLRISEDCDLILSMKAEGEFPATFGRSPVFESFSTTREKHLH